MRAAIALLLLGGCSMLFNERPPHNAQPSDDCTESQSMPSIDTLAAIGLGAVAVVGLTASSSCVGICDASQTRVLQEHVLGAGAVLPAIVYGISAIRGFRDTAACRDLHARRVQGAS